MKRLFSLLTYLVLFTYLLVPSLLAEESNVTEYHLTISEENVNFTGKDVKAMTINSGIPGPTLYFKEGDIASIHVKNEMKVETSIH